MRVVPATHSPLPQNHQHVQLHLTPPCTCTHPAPCMCNRANYCCHSCMASTFPPLALFCTAGNEEPGRSQQTDAPNTTAEPQQQAALNWLLRSTPAFPSVPPLTPTCHFKNAQVQPRGTPENPGPTCSSCSNALLDTCPNQQEGPRSAWHSN